MSQQSVNAQIMGQSYTLSAPSEEAEDLRLAIARVDESMCRIRDAGKIKARDRIAVLPPCKWPLIASKRKAKNKPSRAASSRCRSAQRFAASPEP